MLNNFSNNNLNIAVIGASGGIGRAFVQHLQNLDNIESIYAFSRSAQSFTSPKVTTGFLDFENEDSIQDAAALSSQNAPLDIIIIATGLLHSEHIKPEKSLRDINPDSFAKVITANTIGPALVAKHFLKHIHKNQRSVFAALSARVGSISDNRLGGWYAYRASKSALNMVLKNAAIETARRYKNAAIIGLHPGTVDTDLSQPFQNNVKQGHLFTPDYSAEKLLKIINDVSAEDTGQTFAWDGTRIPN